jgi:hypothetical protein
MSAHGWLLLISSLDSVVAAGTLILIMLLRRWAGVYFAIALAAAVVLILSLTILLRALGLGGQARISPLVSGPSRRSGD